MGIKGQTCDQLFMAEQVLVIEILLERLMRLCPIPLRPSHTVLQTTRMDLPLMLQVRNKACFPEWELKEIKAVFTKSFLSNNHVADKSFNAALIRIWCEQDSQYSISALLVKRIK